MTFYLISTTEMKNTELLEQLIDWIELDSDIADTSAIEEYLELN